MSQLAVLAELGLELDRAIERDARAAAPRRAIGPRRPRTGVVIALAVIVASGGVAAAAGLLPFGSPVRGPAGGEVPARLAPKPGSAVLTGIRVANPYGGDPWALRLARTAAGGTCVAAAHLRDGRFGRPGADGRFHELPLAGTGTCGDPRTDAVVFDVAVTRDAGRRVTIVSGDGGSALRRVAVSGTSGTATGNGAFLAVLAGDRTRTLRVVAHFTDGTSRTLYEPKGAKTK